MAALEHIKLFKQGVQTWNRWRREHPIVRPDLSEANLRYCNLSDIRHWEAILSMQLANIYKVKQSPNGFFKWAQEKGADSSGKGWTPIKQRR